MEISILNFIQENLRSPLMDNIMYFFTLIGDNGIIWIIISLILLFTKKYKHIGIVMLISLTICLCLGELIIKNIICRPRPFYVNQEVVLFISPPLGYSFPSGHTSSSFSSAFLLSKISKKVGILAFTLASLISFSRLYFFVHYPTDVLTGILFGILISYVVCRVYNKKVAKIYD